MRYTESSAAGHEGLAKRVIAGGGDVTDWGDATASAQDYFRTFPLVLQRLPAVQTRRQFRFLLVQQRNHINFVITIQYSCICMHLLPPPPRQPPLLPLLAVRVFFQLHLTGAVLILILILNLGSLRVLFKFRLTGSRFPARVDWILA